MTYWKADLACKEGKYTLIFETNDYKKYKEVEKVAQKMVDKANEEQDEERDEDPCHTCDRQEFCDGWEAQFCCKLCLYYNDDPDCENCDPMDI